MSGETALAGMQDYFSFASEFDFAQYRGKTVYVVLFDVDDFGKFNDSHGREAGDELLVEIARRLMACFGASHTCHYGSDEFIVANAFVSEDALLSKLDAAYRRVAAIGLGDAPLGTTLSVGYAYGPIENPTDLHDAIRTADRRTYDAKRLGKARTSGGSFNETLHDDELRATSQAPRKSYESDELTGLSNLVHFRHELEVQMRQGIGEGDSRLALVYFNIENFKGFNGHFGFEAGDGLLLLVSEEIKREFPGRPAARASADQFVVAATSATAVPGIEGVRAAFRKRIKDSSIWLKAGLNVLADDDDNIDLVIDRAKMACDDIKGRRDVYYRLYDDALRQKIMQRRYVLDHFDEALRNHWVKIFYQPIVRASTGEVCDVEALTRWVDPVEGVISPGIVIPVLEDARLIHRLDLYMVRRACENMRRLRDDGIEFVPTSVNLSRIDFELCDIVAEIKAIMDEFDMPHSMLSIEVTESALSGNQEFLKAEIDRFRAEGFEVWMDDFGSGYSSLHLLTDYQFDLVKVDMGFLRGFETNEQTRVMLAHVISLAKELGLKTLVEGVETDDQLEFLRGIGLGRAQGYLLGRPASLDDVEVQVGGGVYPEIEPVPSHAFYEEIGRINLIRPKPAPPLNGHYVPGDLPAAIVCHRDGMFEYFNVTEMYKVHLANMGCQSVEDGRRRLNDPERDVNHCFMRAIRRLEGEDDWIDESYTANGTTCHLRMRRIAQMPQEGAMAMLVVTNYVF